MEMRYTKYERVRIIAARALQLDMGAPLLIDRPEDVYDPVKLGKIEFEEGVLPITVKRVKGLE